MKGSTGRRSLRDRMKANVKRYDDFEYDDLLNEVCEANEMDTDYRVPKPERKSRKKSKVQSQDQASISDFSSVYIKKEKNSDDSNDDEWKLKLT